MISMKNIILTRALGPQEKKLNYLQAYNNVVQGNMTNNKCNKSARRKAQKKLQTYSI